MTARIIALSLTAVLFLGSSAAADPVRIITAGAYSHSWGEESFFRFEGADFVLGGDGMLVTREEPLFRCQPCAPGTPLDLSATFTGDRIGSGDATFEGRFWPSVFFGGHLQFAARTVIVPNLIDPLLRLPFDFTGQLSAFGAETGGSPVFSSAFVGRGTLFVQLRSVEAGQEVESVLYQFEDVDPVPEPTTLMLLGSGLAGIAMRRRKQIRETRARQNVAPVIPES